jgi:hypothetical protein
MPGDILTHPIVLLALGGLVSGWLVPRITQRWQDQRKALEVKADLVERVAQAVAAIYTAVQFAQVHAESQSQMDFDASYRNCQHEQAVITAQRRA